jgi:outer membrane receptor protein involved in Fe transport
MDLLASFTLNSDPTVFTEHNRSLGVLAKWRRDFPEAWRARLIAGIDIDHSPGGREEDSLIVDPIGNGAARRFIQYTTGPRVYEYDVTYQELSPYLHAEFSPVESVRVTTGVRYDHLSYDFDNHQPPVPIAVARPFPGLRFYGQAADTTLTFKHVSPKLGATWAIDADTHLWASWNHGFRVPSESQLFRPSAATSAAAADELTQSALALEPIKANQAEIGLHGKLRGVSYDLVAYDLEKRDDIVTLRDTATNFTQNVNAGHTRHRGVELGAGSALTSSVRFDIAWSWAEHRYVDWLTSTGDFSGKEIEFAPHGLGNARLTWAPKPKAQLQAEVVHVGSYWLDAANTVRYPGHDLLNLRGSWPLSQIVSVFASVYNVADKRYADSASITSSTPVYSPGLPRTFYGGFEVAW